MRLDCVRVEETIWDCAREGREVPESVLLHAQSCRSCGQALREAKTGCLTLASALGYPPAPDCRAAVAARIATPVARPRQLKWALAFGAAVVIVAGCTLPMLRHEPRTGSGQVSVRPAPPPQRRAVEKTIPPQPSAVERQAPRVREQAPSLQPSPRRAPAQQNPEPKRRPATIKRAIPKVPAPPPRPEHVALAQPRDDRPVAVVLVSWDQNPEPSNSYTYSRTDPETGITTTCKVTERNGVVEVDMQSSPQPDNGGTTNETIPGV